jgi:hypothetical protein
MDDERVHVSEASLKTGPRRACVFGYLLAVRGEEIHASPNARAHGRVRRFMRCDRGC